MKRIIPLLVFALMSPFGQAQQKATHSSELPSLFLSPGLSLHLVSPEPIQYVDLSDNRMVGDLPVENVLRIKFLVPDEQVLSQPANSGPTIVTVVGQTYLAQYAVYFRWKPEDDMATHLDILPEQMHALDFPGVSLSPLEMKRIALQVIRQKRTYRDVKARQTGMLAWLNNIYANGDYIFIDVSFRNQTRIPYAVDAFRFRLKDKRITRSTNVQEVELKPVFSLYQNDSFQRSYRNVFVFPKFSYPGNKVFSVELSEEQISGRTIELLVDYSDLLHADTL